MKERPSYSLTELKGKERKYQQEAKNWALERSGSVVCLPTGTGKTLVGCMWSCELLNRGDAKRILIVEPSRFLVEQIYEYYLNHTNIPAEKLYGTTPAEERPSRWGKGVAVVTTPQTAYNDLEFLDFDATVVDECHHTTGEHAFAKLMRSYEFDFKLGLSATIPRKMEAEIEKLVGEIRRWSWDHPDVKEYVPSWFGEVYYSEYPAEYRSVESKLDEFRNKWDGTSLAVTSKLGN